MRGNRKVIWISLLAVLLLAGAVTVASAQNPKRPQQKIRAAVLRGMFLGGLDLTDQQKTQIKTILANHKADIRAVVVESVKARKDLRQALAEGTDQSALKAAYDQLSAARWNALLLRRNIGSEIKPILTAEQQAKLQKRLQNIRKIG